MRKIPTALAVVAALALTLAACEGSSDEEQQTANVTDEQRAINNALASMTDSQPAPVFDWSQERQTVIDSETIRATAPGSTTQFYLEGVGMVQWCPSIGAPVPSTYQLTASQQYVDIPGDQDPGKFPVDQAEPTGTYIGPSTATWVVCLDDDGKQFGVYWEGPVGSTIGTVSGLERELRIQPSDLTFEFTTEGTE